MAAQSGASDRSPRVAELIEGAASRLATAGVDSPRLDAELLMAEASGASRADVLTGGVDLDPAQLAKFYVLVARRVAREPLAYLVGRREFYSIEFEVNSSVLIPRPETETLVAAALDFLAEAPAARVLDVGTGSGAIAIALAVNAPRARVLGVDISEAALQVAARNAARAHVARRGEFRRGNLFEPLDERGPFGRFDLIVSNPPYIDDAALARLEPEVARYEPRVALVGGRDGLDFYRRLAAGVRNHFEPGGALMLEVGAGQADAVGGILRAAGMHGALVLNDLSGIERVVTVRI